MTEKYKTIELCAGIGGMRRGFEMTSCFENVFSVENDKYACKTYEHLFGDNPMGNLADNELKLKTKTIDYDVLLSSFPCQSFFTVGHRNSFEDARGTVFLYIAEIINMTRPRAFLLESAKNLITHDKGKTFQTICKMLIETLDYKIAGVKWDKKKQKYIADNIILNTKDFGLPQNRPRTFLMGFDNKRYKDKYHKIANWMWNLIPAEKIKYIMTIDEVLDIGETNPKYYLGQKTWEYYKKRQRKHQVMGHKLNYIIINDENYKKDYINNLTTSINSQNRNFVRDYVKEYDGIMWGQKKSPLNDEGIRILNPMEFAKLQGYTWAFDDFSFPEKLSDKQKFKQMGNSVSIPVIKALADRMATMLYEMEEC